jgi:hypothetical protein
MAGGGSPQTDLTAESGSRDDGGAARGDATERVPDGGRFAAVQRRLGRAGRLGRLGRIVPVPAAGRWRTALVVGGLTLVVAVPLLIAICVLRQPDIASVSDTAQIELRVRDVGLSHPPVVGLPGRIRGFDAGGSHPGPLSFYALAPVYRLLGADGWSLLASVAVLSTVAAAVSIWIGYRRGGWRFALAVAGGLTWLVLSYGPWRMVSAWNPDMPLMWWFVLLLAVWSVLCGDLVLLPVAVLAGSFCAQTHVPYMALVGGLFAVLAVWLAVGWRRSDAEDRRRILRWSAVGGGLVLVLWLPPLVEQLAEHPGNLAIIVENFRDPYDEQISVGDAAEVWAQQLDITGLLRSSYEADLWRPVGATGRGVVCLVAWGACAVVAVRRDRRSALTRLHLLVGITLVFGLVATSRIFGPVWPYLTRWAWGTTALMTIAIGWTLLTSGRPPWLPFARRGLDAPPDDADPPPDAAAPSGLAVTPVRAPRVAGAVLALVAVLGGGLLANNAAHAETSDQPVSVQMARLAAATSSALRDDPAGCGDACHYVVSWEDPEQGGAQGFGMVVALEGRGFDARTIPEFTLMVRRHRAIDPDDADAGIHVAIGAEAIMRARAEPDATEIAYDDPREDSDRALRSDLAATLEAEGYDDLAEQVRDEPPARIAGQDEMSLDLQGLLYLWDVGYQAPAAVFLVIPPGDATTGFGPSAPPDPDDPTGLITLNEIQAEATEPD